jgi:hypothetical protein
VNCLKSATTSRSSAVSPAATGAADVPAQNSADNISPTINTLIRLTSIRAVTFAG